MADTHLPPHDPATGIEPAPDAIQIVAPGEVHIEETVRGYWDLVWIQFRKNRVAFSAFALITSLFLIAAWAPVLANGKPFVWTQNGETSYPLIRYLVSPTEKMSVDYIFNYLFFFTLVFPPVLLVGWMKVRGKMRLRKIVRRLILIAALISALPFIAPPSQWKFDNELPYVHILRSWKLDAKKYPDIAASLKPENGDRAIFPFFRVDPITPTRDFLKAPSKAHLLGTDRDGRDVLARLVHGARIALSVGFVAVSIEILLGVFFGALAGYFRGWVDILISRFMEILLCFPQFFLILIIVAMVEPEKRSVFHIMVVIGMIGWVGTARLVRGEFLKLADQDFVQSARALGSSNSRLMFRHMLPNAMGPVLVTAAFEVAGAILIESGLSFLGFGAPPPTPTWGEMINQGKEHLDEAWWLIVYPGLSIFLTVTVYNLAGDGLRDAMDPKMRH